jgi:hypothetical protein
MPRIGTALDEQVPVDVAQELREIVEERYAFLDRYWPLIAIIERCAVEIPQLEEAWFGFARAGTFEELGAHFEPRVAEGLLRTMPDYRVAARIITEALSWSSWHRREGRDAAVYDDDAARPTVIDLIRAALVPPDRQ